jgi:hypothetical protein
VSLVVTLYQKSPQARLYWLRVAQPSACAIERFDEQGVQMAAIDLQQQRRLPSRPTPFPEGAAGERLGAVMLGAVQRGDLETVRRLLPYEAAARATNRSGQMPLALAVIWNDGAAWLEIARVLVKAGAPLDARDRDALTALGHAEMRTRRKGHDGHLD